MNILIALCIVASILKVVINFIDWTLRKFGFCLTVFEQAIRNSGYSESYYWQHAQKDMIMNQKLIVELEKIKEIEWNKSNHGAWSQAVDCLKDIDNNKRYFEALKQCNYQCNNSLNGLKERLKNNYNLVI